MWWFILLCRLWCNYWPNHEGKDGCSKGDQQSDGTEQYGYDTHGYEQVNTFFYVNCLLWTITAALQKSFFINLIGQILYLYLNMTTCSFQWYIFNGQWYIYLCWVLSMLSFVAECNRFQDHMAQIQLVFHNIFWYVYRFI